MHLEQFASYFNCFKTKKSKFIKSTNSPPKKNKKKFKKKIGLSLFLCDLRNRILKIKIRSLFKFCFTRTFII